MHRISALLIGLVFLQNLSGQESNAHRDRLQKVADAINDVETQTWTTTVWSRALSPDAKRSWLQISRIDFAFKTPGLNRSTRYSRNGKVRSVEIVDTSTPQTLRLDMKSKQAVANARSPNQYGPGAPLAWVASVLRSPETKFIGQRKIGDVTVDVFRGWRGENDARNSLDVWLDPDTDRLVGVSEPGADQFDPTTDPDRDFPAEKKASMGMMMGMIISPIELNAPIESELFSLDVPDGFELSK